MQVHNMLEREGHGYKSGNIRLVKIKPDFIEVFKKGGEVIKYKRVGVVR